MPNPPFRPALLLTALLACAPLAPLPALAQPAPPSQTLDFTIAAGPLGPALNQFARRAGIYLGGAGALTEGRQTPGLNGRYTVEQGLAQLLSGAGLEARESAPGRYVLHPIAGTATLEPVTVTGAHDAAGAFVAEDSVSATKTDIPLMETPRSVSVVTRAQLDARGVVTMPEAVRYSAGVGTGSAGFDPRFDQISIRGFPVNTTGDYLDGLRQTPGSYAYFRTDPYALERVDIVKGPMSVLYGQGTPGGLVNRVSKRPLDEPLREIMVMGGTKDRKQVAFDIADHFNEEGTARFRLTGLTRRGDHDRMIADDRDVFAPAFDFKLGDKTTLTVLGQYIRDETDANVGMYTDENGKVTHIRVSDPRYDRQRQTQYQLGYELAYRHDDALTLRQQVRYGHIDLDARYLSGAGLQPGTRLLNRNAWSVESSVQNVLVDNNAQVRVDTGNAKHQFLAGFDYQRLNWDQGVGLLATGYPALDLDNPKYGYVPGPTPPYNLVSVDQRNTQYGVYLSDQVSIGNWRLNLGGRYDIAQLHSQDRLNGGDPTRKKDNAFTWQAGALYLSDSGLAPYVSYVTSFAPNTSLDAAGKPLDPTHGAQIEAGVKYQPQGSHSYVTLAAYQIKEKDAVRVVPATPYSELAGGIRSRGVELEAVAQLQTGLQLVANYSYNRGKVTDSNNPAEIGKTPSYQPRHSAAMWLDYRLPQGPLAGLGLGAGVRYVGSSYGNAQNTMHNDASTLFDLALSYEPGYQHPALKGWMAMLSVQNVADKETTVCDGGYCYLGVGRQIMGSLRYRW